jgi:ankyrin repeat protein
MSVSNRQLFINSIHNGDEQAFKSLLPQIKLSQLGVKRILKQNMKLKHDFILKELLLKKYISRPSYLEELLLAAIHHHYDLGVKYALRKGALPNGLNAHGTNPLVFAIKNENRAAIKLLLQSGADPLLKKGYSSGLSAAIEKLDMELIELFQSYGTVIPQVELQNALATAAKADRFDLVDRFLLMGAHFQASTYFGTTFANPAVIPKLLKRDFRFNLRYEPCVNFFSLAARFGLLMTLKEFIKHGRHRTPEDEYVKTLSVALISAAGKGKEAIVSYLLSQGADINYVDKGGTAFDAAIAGKYIKLANYLLRSGGCSAKDLVKEA